GIRLQYGSKRWRMATAHPPDPAQAELFSREDLAPLAEAGGGEHQELGVRAAFQRAGAGGPQLDPARDRRGRRRRLAGGGAADRGPERRAGEGDVPLGARRRLSGGGRRDPRALARPAAEGRDRGREARRAGGGGGAAAEAGGGDRRARFLPRPQPRAG